MKQQRPKIYLWLIRVISLIVPRRLRSGWKQEWDAEMIHRWSTLDEWRHSQLRGKRELLRRGNAALLDAIWLQPYRWEEEMIQDLRYGLRMFVKNPGFTAIAVISLALGIGANTAIFSVIDKSLIHPLSYYDPDQLYSVWETNPDKDSSRSLTSMPTFLDWREQTTAFEQMSVMFPARFSVTGVGEPESIKAEFVSDTFFTLFGPLPGLGRNFLPEDDKPGAAPVAIISRSLWERKFSASSAAIGRGLVLDDKSYTIVGVMTSAFQDVGFSPAEVWLPGASNPNESAKRNVRRQQVFARLKRGVTVEQATAQMQTIANRLSAQYPDTNSGWGIRLYSLRYEVTGDIKEPLLVLFGAVGFVLLISCTNIATLLLTRATRRRKEMAIRAALGAGRLRLIRQLLVESLLLAICGGTLGLFLAWLGIKPLVLMISRTIAQVNQAEMDGRVMFFTLAISMITGILFGIVPAFFASRNDVNSALKDGGGSSRPGFRRNIPGNALIIVEVGLTVILLIGSGLMIKTFLHLRPTSPGFDPSNKLTFSVHLPKTRYSSDRQIKDFYKEVIDRTSRIFGVTAVTGATTLPFTGTAGLVDLSIDGKPTSNDKARRTFYAGITPNYFRVMHTPLIAGREFSDSDNESSHPVFLIGQTLARRYWPNESPLGSQITVTIGQQVITGGIVGVVADQRLFASDTNPRQFIYVPFTQASANFFDIVVQVNSDPVKFAPAVREQVWSIDRDLPLTQLLTMEQLLDGSMEVSRSYAVLMGLFASIALILALVGVYGVMAYSVSQRTQEISIRMALGAKTGDVLRLILRQGSLLIFVGLTIGLAGAFALTRFMASLLREISTTDPVTFIAVAALMAGVMLLACLVPAGRATRLDPLKALKSD